MQRFLQFVKKPTSLNIIVNTLGNYINIFFVAFFALLLVRIMSPQQYGVLSVLLGIAYVLANILDFGTTATIYSYLPPMYEKKQSNLYHFLKSTFYYQSLFSLIVIGVLFITFPYLDKAFFKTGAPLWELYLTAFSVLFFVWQNFILNSLYATKKFLKASVYLNLSNLIKTLIIFVLMLFKMVSIGSIIFVFGVVGPAIFFILLFFEKKHAVSNVLKAKVAKDEFRFGYTLTFFVASQFLNLGLRMDLFLLSFFGFKTGVGYYGLSQKIILTIVTTIISITQVLSPGFSKIHDINEVKSHFKTGLVYLLLPCGLFLVLFILPDQVFYLFFTEKFAQTASITKALSLPFIIYTLGNLPQLFILYTLKKPLPILVSNIVFFLTVTLGCYFLIPRLGVFGPPYALGAAFLLNTLILTGVAFFEYRNHQSPHKEDLLAGLSP
jgi:PST family polysaccharide transporter